MACVEVATEINSQTEPYTNAKHHYKHEQYINELTAITANCKFCSHAGAIVVLSAVCEASNIGQHTATL